MHSSGGTADFGGNFELIICEFSRKQYFLRSLWSVKPIIHSLMGRAPHFLFIGKTGVKNVVSQNAVGG
jgi:hypothetical protein